MDWPSTRLSPDEIKSGALSPTTRLLGQQMLASQGVVVVENAFSPEFIVSLRKAFLAQNGKYLVDQETGRTLKVGDKRIMIPVRVAAEFNSPQLYANPVALPLVQDALGVECVLGSFGAVTSLSGAEDQHVHRDHPFLFQEEAIDVLMPAFAVNVVVPLVDLNKRNGTTRVWPGSHRVWTDEKAKQLPSRDIIAPIGSCILMDYRLLHGGTANRSERLRPILYLIYHRPWFKDYVNFLKVREISVPTGEIDSIPEAYRKWFEPRAGEHS